MTSLTQVADEIKAAAATAAAGSARGGGGGGFGKSQQKGFGKGEGGGGGGGSKNKKKAAALEAEAQEEGLLEGMPVELAVDAVLPSEPRCVCTGTWRVCIGDHVCTWSHPVSTTTTLTATKQTNDPNQTASTSPPRCWWPRSGAASARAASACPSSAASARSVSTSGL